jgi:pyruvate-formate lyase-activating enzyme
VSQSCQEQSQGRPRPSALRIRRIACVITTRCTLRCPHCAHLNSRYSEEERRHTPVALALTSIKRLLHVCDSVEAVSLMGGEALLHPGLETFFPAATTVILLYPADTKEKSCGRVKIILLFMRSGL